MSVGICLIKTVISIFFIDINECLFSPSVCGPNSTCTNEKGSYSCSCLNGFTATNLNLSISINNTCTGKSYPIVYVKILL